MGGVQISTDRRASFCRPINWLLGTERARRSRRTRTFAALCAASSGERRSPGDASTAGSNATEERGSKDANASFVIAGNQRFPACSQNAPRSDDITRELCSLERQRVPGVESAEGFLDSSIPYLNTTRGSERTVKNARPVWPLVAIVVPVCRYDRTPSCSRCRNDSRSHCRSRRAATATCP